MSKLFFHWALSELDLRFLKIKSSTKAAQPPAAPSDLKDYYLVMGADEMMIFQVIQNGGFGLVWTWGQGFVAND